MSENCTTGKRDFGHFQVILLTGCLQSRCREGSTMPVSLHTKKEFPAQNSFSKGRNLLDDVTAGFF